MIKRNLYLEEIKKYINKPIIKVITGMRRSGKSMILKLIQEELQNIGIVKENIIYMNFESLTFMDIKDFEALYKHIIEKTSDKKGKIYILLDEIQEVKGWEKAINSFLVDLDVDIYITGSNANLLSSELATYIAGRYVEIKIYPLSFQEYIDFVSEGYLRKRIWLKKFLKSNKIVELEKGKKNVSAKEYLYFHESIRGCSMFNDVVDEN